MHRVPSNATIVSGVLTAAFYAVMSGEIESRFTASQPRVYPGGIVHVMVNGELAMHDGARTENQAGRVLRDFQV